jgi:TonB family protein
VSRCVLRLAVPALLAIAPALAAQTVPRGPRLLQVAASSGGVVLSIDSTTLARSGDSTFLAEAVYQFPADPAQRVAADRQVDSQELDCAGMRFRGRRSTYFVGEASVPVSSDSARPSTAWQTPCDDELPLVQALCGYLLGSFAATLPITREVWSADEQPEIANGDDVTRELGREYPPAARRAGVGGRAMLRFQITADGHVDPASARALWASRDDIAAAGLRVVRVMRFHPAKEHGVPVAVWVTVPITFWIDSDDPVSVDIPGRRPTSSPVWGGRSPTPTRPIHPNPTPVTP